MRRKNKTPLTLSKAVNIATDRKINAMLPYRKLASAKKFKSRVKSFMAKYYSPLIGLKKSIEIDLLTLKLQGMSKSYIRGMKSTLNNLLSLLPTCQPEII